MNFRYLLLEAKPSSRGTAKPIITPETMRKGTDEAGRNGKLIAQRISTTIYSPSRIIYITSYPN
jgi:hypothetical protein